MDDVRESPDVWPHGETALETLFRHNLWANMALFDACAALDEAQLATTATGTYGTIYDTLSHIARAEQGYLYHLTGGSPTARLSREGKLSVDVLREHLRLFGESLIAVAAEVEPLAIATMRDEEGNWAIPAGVVLTQVINHATEHRAHIMTILTQTGIEPPDLSGWAFGDRYGTFTSNK